MLGNRIFSAWWLLLSVFSLFLSSMVQAETYTSGHGALQLWDDQAKANLPEWIRYWLLFMLAVFACGLLFVWRHVEARWLVGGVIAGLLFSRFAVPALDLAPLSGLVALVHLVFWSPALFFMLKNRPFVGGLSLYGSWAALATGCILFSFVFDIRDAAIYVWHLMAG